MTTLLDICFTEKKSDLRSLCKKVAISEAEFADFVMECECKLRPWLHKISYRDFVPEHLHVTEQDMRELHDDKGGPPISRAVYKRMRAFRERRYLVGHVFYTPDLTNWHLFYFDQRDAGEHRTNHWKGGPHIHLINYLWPDQTCKSAWDHFNSGNVQMSGALHIKFDRNFSKNSQI